MSIIEDDRAGFAPELLTPTIESSVFADAPDARFWLGKIGNGAIIEMPVEYKASGVFRANVYIDEKRFLPDGARQADGAELDEYDARSVHFAVLENQVGANGLARLVGTTRLIVKNSEEELLPVETFFPEVFAANPVNVNDSEVSRFIARHPSKLVQSSLSLSLIRAMTLHANRNGSEHAYAVVEEGLARRLAYIGLPFEELTDPKMIPEYNTKNMAIKFEPEYILQQIAADTSGKRILSLFFDRAIQESDGLGYFDQTLISPLQIRVV